MRDKNYMRNQVQNACLLLVFAVSVAGAEGFPQLGYHVVPDWPQLPEGVNFRETASVAADARGHVFVFHRGPKPIMEFDAGGAFIRAWGDGTFVNPHGLRFDPEGNLWAVDNGGHFVVKMDGSRRIRMVLGRRDVPGTTDALFNGPTDVAFGPNGDVYVTDGYGNSRVVKFTKAGTFVRTWGRKGTGPSEFNTPHSIVVDKRGRVYVGDRENNRIQIFDPDGKLLTQWTHLGSPWGLYLTPDETLYMADGRTNNRVLKLNLEGQVLGAFGKPGKLPGEFLFAHHLTVSPAGEIYVAEILNWRVQKFVLK
jgi:DNA-binding beta-propeller fold protein YncE